MSTLFITHSSALLHETGYGHPERADRIRVICNALEREKFRDLWREEAPLATRNELMLAHPDDYIGTVFAQAPQKALTHIDSETIMSPGTLEAALRAVGGAIYAVDHVMSGRFDNAFVAMRPPGHHAERNRSMGFCFFNTIAIAARHARAKYGAERVAIVDFDVHHGNGTQDIFYDDPTVMFASTHEMPLYPGTGHMSETGSHHQIVNVPLRAGDDGTVFREAVETALLPRLKHFSPDLVLVSAGFDAHQRDPMANINLLESDYVWITDKLMKIADQSCKSRVVSILEGGYELLALSESTAAHVSTLMGV